MNTKKFAGAVCALACAISITTTQPAYAGLFGGGMSASEQERWARKLEQKEFGNSGPQVFSSDAINSTPYVQQIQKRVCDANGIRITNNTFTSSDDHKDTVHPIKVIDNYMYCTSVGAGYIYLGATFLKGMNVTGFANQFDYMATAQIISHELFHGIDGHLVRSTGKDNEFSAEKGSIKLLDRLPEGGWGAYLVAINRNAGYADQISKLIRSLGEETNGKVCMPFLGHPKYTGRDGKEYQLIANSWDGRDGYKQDDNAYFGGQLAYCIAKGALKLDNIAVVENHLKQDIKFKGDYLLVCKDARLPNGYRVLTELYGSKDLRMSDLATAKEKARSSMPLSRYGEMKAYWIDKDESLWKIWLACAVAADVEK